MLRYVLNISVVFSLFTTFSFITDDAEIKAFEKFAGEVYKSIQDDDFEKFHSLCMTTDEYRQFLITSQVDDTVITRLVNRRAKYATKEAFNDEFNRLQKCSKSEGVSWPETSLLKYVTKIRMDGRKAEVRIVVGYRNLEFVLYCEECFLTVNGWKLSSQPACISIQEEKKHFRKSLEESEKER